MLLKKASEETDHVQPHFLEESMFAGFLDLRTKKRHHVQNKTFIGWMLKTTLNFFQEMTSTRGVYTMIMSRRTKTKCPQIFYWCTKLEQQGKKNDKARIIIPLAANTRQSN